MNGAVPGDEITFIFESDPVVLGIATADAGGTAVLETSWPLNAADGTHTVRAVGHGRPGTLALQTECVLNDDVGVLARTGIDPGLLLLLGGSLVLAGVLVLRYRPEGA